MKKIVVSCKDLKVLNKIERILKFNNFSYETEETNIRKKLFNATCLIIHSSNKIPNIHKLVENIVYEKRVYVIFIDPTKVVGMFYNVIDDPYFYLLDENKIEYELGVIIKTMDKYIKKINILETKITNLSLKIQTDKKINKTKRYLQNSGMTEEDAHKYILKISMDKRVSKLKACEDILVNFRE